MKVIRTERISFHELSLVGREYRCLNPGCTYTTRTVGNRVEAHGQCGPTTYQYMYEDAIGDTKAELVDDILRKYKNLSVREAFAIGQQLGEMT